MCDNRTPVLCGVFKARWAGTRTLRNDCAIKAAAQIRNIDDGKHGGYGPARIVSAGMLVLYVEYDVNKR